MKLRSGKRLNGETVQQEQEQEQEQGQGQPIVAVLPNPPTKQQIQNMTVASRPFQQHKPYFYEENKMKLRSGKRLNGETVQQEQEQEQEQGQGQPIVAVLPNPPTKQQIQNMTVASRPFQQHKPYFYEVETKKDCGHECCLWVKDKCCECMDKRPILEDTKGYKAYNNAYLVDFSLVSRHYYYCGKCKDRLKKPIVNSKEAEIATLEKKVAELEKELIEIKRQEAERNLWESGLEDLCWHLGYCSDIMMDSWFIFYEEKGLLYLKSQLWDESKKHHKGYSCKDCNKIIKGLSD